MNGGQKHITVHDRHGSRSIPLYEGDVLPPLPPVPTTMRDPYAAYLPNPTQLIVRYDLTPQARAWAMLTKTTAVTIFLSLLTLAGLFLLDRFSFLLWLLLASAEWVLCFLLLALLDWRETPTALAWRQSEGYLQLMRREQAAHLAALYGVKELAE
jgi:hypothetical protein